MQLVLQMKHSNLILLCIKRPKLNSIKKVINFEEGNRQRMMAKKARGRLIVQLRVIKMVLF